MTLQPPSLTTILSTWLGLLGLTLLTSLLGLVNLGAMKPSIAVIIAAIQASLIALFLMHALKGPALIRVISAGGVIWFLIMMVLTLTDFVTRGWLLPYGK
jgi:cytochrome c oxidase subunit IV